MAREALIDPASASQMAEGSIVALGFTIYMKQIRDEPTLPWFHASGENMYVNYASDAEVDQVLAAGGVVLRDGYAAELAARTARGEDRDAVMADIAQRAGERLAADQAAGIVRVRRSTMLTAADMDNARRITENRLTGEPQ